jgi:hypothetical protein
MSKIYVDQTVTIELVSDTNISAATNKIKYKKPNGATGEWLTPTLTGNYTLSYKTTLDISGWWTFWVHSTWGTDVIPSTVASLEVYVEGT